MARGGEIRAGRAFVELYVKNFLAKGLRNAGKQMSAFGKSISTLGTKVLGVGAAITGPLAGAVAYFSHVGDSLDKISARTGVAVEFLSALGHAANLGGSDLAAMEKGLRKMQKTALDAAQGGESAKEAFAALGVSAKGVDGKLKGTEQLFMESVKGLAALKSETAKAALAQEIFGRAGTAMLPMLSNGAKGFEAAMKEAEAMGLVMSTKDATAAAVFTDALDRLTASVKMVVFRIGAALAPTLTIVADKMREVFPPIIEWIKRNGNLILTVAKVGAVIVAVGGVLVGLGTTIALIGSALTGAGAIVGTFGTILGAIVSPVGLAIAVIAALGYWITFHTDAGAAALDWLKKNFKSLSDFVGPIIQGIKDALSAGDITLAAKILWLGLKVAFAEGAAMVTGVWRNFLNGLEAVYDEVFTNILAKFRTFHTNVASLILRMFDKLGGPLRKSVLGNLSLDDVLNTLNEDAARAQSRARTNLNKRTAARNNADNFSTAADQAEIAKLRAALGATLKQARQEAVEAELRKAQAKPPEPPQQPPGVPALAMAGGMARGSFSAFAASTFGRGANRQIQLLESIDARLKDQNDMMEDEEPLDFT